MQDTDNPPYVSVGVHARDGQALPVRAQVFESNGRTVASLRIGEQVILYAEPWRLADTLSEAIGLLFDEMEQAGLALVDPAEVSA